MGPGTVNFTILLCWQAAGSKTNRHVALRPAPIKPRLHIGDGPEREGLQALAQQSSDRIY
jgi:hypothetical protein